MKKKKEKVYIVEGGDYDGELLVVTSLTEPEIEIAPLFYVSAVWVESVLKIKFKFIGYL